MERESPWRTSWAFSLGHPQQCANVAGAPCKTTVNSDWADWAVFLARPNSERLRLSVEIKRSRVRGNRRAFFLVQWGDIFGSHLSVLIWRDAAYIFRASARMVIAYAPWRSAPDSAGVSRYIRLDSADYAQQIMIVKLVAKRSAVSPARLHGQT